MREVVNDILEKHSPKEVIMWECLDSRWVVELKNMKLELKVDEATGKLKILVATNTIRRSQIDPLRVRLRAIIEGSGMRAMDIAVLLLQLIEEAIRSMLPKKDKQIKDDHFEHVEIHSQTRLPRWHEARFEISGPLTGSPKEMGSYTMDSDGSGILGIPIKEICQRFDECFRVVNIEPVHRKDLVSAFQARQEQIYEDLLRMPYDQLRHLVPITEVPNTPNQGKMQNLCRALTTPKVTFHGTSHGSIPSIVRWGFLLPGQKAGGLHIRTICGATFGAGIYSSSNPMFALAYSYGLGGGDTAPEKVKARELNRRQLIVCATLMGRPQKVSRFETKGMQGTISKNVHSHVSPTQLEYVVFNPTQIIPCYVVHFENLLNEDAKKVFAAYSGRSKQLQEIKQGKKAAAAKYFPYGFGSAKGSSFKIEEIGKVDDDEEEYGEYQKQRTDPAVDKNTWVSPESSSRGYLYQDARDIDS
ncbi:hypothetical protein G7Y89_g14983 [Cudoniella acicularis]|uniref:Poly [ADP-ribose] polymerase n=1 Tax=Cudoniella acicularis TaxID=354080 RepID=A0A8H4QV76_9HELO|nr:hypothetical protein G7Y89_g14983 [Cudoniella acicularis]